MIVTAWNNGNRETTGAGYGIKISKVDRDAHFNRAWKHIEIDIPGIGTVQASLSTSFRGNCIEIRSKHIGAWLIRNNLAPWRKNSPPMVHLISAESNKFKLRK